MTSHHHNKVTRIPENISSGTPMLKRHRQMTSWEVDHAGKPGRADLHMHSTYSDGTATIEQILDHVEHQTHLDVIALAK